MTNETARWLRAIADGEEIEIYSVTDGWCSVEPRELLMQIVHDDLLWKWRIKPVGNKKEKSNET